MKKKTIIRKLLAREPLTFSEKATSWLTVFLVLWTFLFFLLGIKTSFIVALILTIHIIILIKYINKVFPYSATIEKIRWMIGDATPTELENIIANMYGRLGYRIIEVTPPSGDRGADIVLKRKNIKYVVQVKKYSQENKVGTPDLQKLQGAKEEYRTNGMKIVTTGFFSSFALDYAHRHRIETIDGDELLILMYKSYKRDNKFYNNKNTE